MIVSLLCCINHFDCVITAISFYVINMKKIGCHKNRRIFGRFPHTNTNTSSHVPDFSLSRHTCQHTSFRLDRPKPDANPRFSSKENSIHTQVSKLTSALPPISHHNTSHFTLRKSQKTQPALTGGPIINDRLSKYERIKILPKILEICFFFKETNFCNQNCLWLTVNRKTFSMRFFFSTCRL